jgi:UDP-N-acetylglucosamine--N-acetylmuramyl-(pentapeptide) pyrophosphoryl-undecaprenol N-acetylglucosamine transferase
MIERAVIAGGKTGGHLYPGVAVAEEILARNPDAVITFIGTKDGIESWVLPRLGYRLETITASRLKGGGLVDRLLGLLRVPIAMIQTWRLLRTLRPQVVLGVGGYASGPALLAAWCSRYPTAIQEQNAHPGLTNRILGRFVRAIYVGFEAASRHFRSAPVLVTGNPIRRALVTALTDQEARSEGEANALSVLVFGGSQGARFLNENVPAALAAFHKGHPEVALDVVHQTGLHDEAAVRERYDAGPLADRVTVLPFIHDMPSAYAASDLAICRAGALTIAEVTAVGLPCLFVPFPFAADNHQEANAQVMVDRDAGTMVRQSEWTEEQVSSWLADLARDPARRLALSRHARALARPDAAVHLVDHLEKLAA